VPKNQTKKQDLALLLPRRIQPVVGRAPGPKIFFVAGAKSQAYRVKPTRYPGHQLQAASYRRLKPQAASLTIQEYKII